MSNLSLFTERRVSPMDEPYDPPWVAFPGQPLGSVFWKMGGGEEYLNQWLEQLLTLSHAEQDTFLAGGQIPEDWRAMLVDIVTKDRNGFWG